MRIRLYFNDPLGGRWSRIGAAVAALKERYGLDVEIVTRRELGFFRRLLFPRLPAIEIDGDTVFAGQEITAEALEEKIIQRL